MYKMLAMAKKNSLITIFLWYNLCLKFKITPGFTLKSGGRLAATILFFGEYYILNITYFVFFTKYMTTYIRVKCCLNIEYLVFFTIAVALDWSVFCFV